MKQIRRLDVTDAFWNIEGFELLEGFSAWPNDLPLVS